MAYGLKYTSSFKDFFNNSFKIELLKKDYSGSSSIIKNLAPDPVGIFYSGDKNKQSNVQGSSLTFAFLESTNLGENYDDIFSSNYMDYKLQFINTDTSTIKWVGYVKPENLTRPFLDRKRFIQLEATDGIADLKDMDYSSIGERIPILNVIKNALSPINLELPFKIQLNTYETNHMSKGQCPLKQAYINTKKFQKVNDGKVTYDNSYTVIEKVLQPFNSQLKQINGNYYITNNNEIDSSLYTYDWSTLTQQSITNTNNIIDISAYSFIPTSDFTKIRPLKRIDLIFNNLDVGGTLVNDISSWTNTSIWRIKAPTSTVESDNTLRLSNAAGTDCSIGLVNPFRVNHINDNEYVRLSYNIKIAPNPPNTDEDDIYVKHYLKKEGDAYNEIDSYILPRSLDYYYFTSPASVDWQINSDIEYELYVVITAPLIFNNMVIRIRDLGLTQVNIMNGDDASINYDRNFIGDISINKDKYEDTIYFSDSAALSEISSISIGNNTLSTKWSNYSNDASGSLQYLYANTLLKNNQAFRDYITLDVRDGCNNITQNSIIKLNTTKKYSINNYERNYKNGTVKLGLAELLTYNPSEFTFFETILSSVNGESTITSSTATPSLVTDHGELTGLSDNDHPQYVLKIGDTMTGNLTINSSLFVNGKVGIGLTNPEYTLDVINKDTIWNTRFYSNYTSNNYSNLLNISGAMTSAVGYLGVGGANSTVTGTKNSFAIGTQSNHNVNIVTNDTIRITLLNSGALVVQSDVSTTGDVLIPTGKSLWVGNTADNGGRTRVHQQGTASYLDFGDILYTRGGLTTSNNIMVCTSSGKVGIGTVTPTSILDVSLNGGSIRCSGDIVAYAT